MFLLPPAAVTVLCTILTFALPINGQQCPVSVPTIVSSSSSDDICAVVTQGTLSYTCSNDNLFLVWTSSVFSGTINVIASVDTGTLPMPATGVTLTENDNNNTMCLNSTLTFTGKVADLEQLNGVVLTCTDGTGLTDDSVTIVIPGPPTSVNASSATCGSRVHNQVTLQWTPPTNTGGQGVMITHYNITGLPQSASCSTGPCDMVDGTATTITGLQCNTSYTVAVRAVNCRGIGNGSQVMINLRPPGKPLFHTACINNGYLTLDWTPPMDLQSDCGSSLSYNLTVSDTDSSSSLLLTSTNARVPVDGSDNYTVTIFASNGCPGVAEEIVISTTCVSPSSTVSAAHSLHTTSSIPATNTLPDRRQPTDGDSSVTETSSDKPTHDTIRQ